MVGEPSTPDHLKLVNLLFQSRCRDWVVGELKIDSVYPIKDAFQSRCRDWVVGELSSVFRSVANLSFSLVAEIGWLASVNLLFTGDKRQLRFSLVAEIGWLASVS